MIIKYHVILSHASARPLRSALILTAPTLSTIPGSYIVVTIVTVSEARSALVVRRGPGSRIGLRLAIQPARARTRLGHVDLVARALAGGCPGRALLALVSEAQCLVGGYALCTRGLIWLIWLSVRRLAEVARARAPALHVRGILYALSRAGPVGAAVVLVPARRRRRRRRRNRSPRWRDGLWAFVGGRGLDVRRLRLLNDSGGGDVLAELAGRDADALNRCADYGLRVAEDESGGADNGEEKEGDDAYDGGRGGAWRLLRRDRDRQERRRRRSAAAREGCLRQRPRKR